MYEVILIYCIYPTIMTEVNVSGSVGMSGTVDEINISDSGEIEYFLNRLQSGDFHS